MTEVLPAEEGRQDRVENILRGFQMYPFATKLIKIALYDFFEGRLLRNHCNLSLIVITSD